MIGDRMDTDVVAGLEAGMRTVLVLTGITQPGDVERFPFRPSRVVNSIADLIDDLPVRPEAAEAASTSPGRRPEGPRRRAAGVDLTGGEGDPPAET